MASAGNVTMLSCRSSAAWACHACCRVSADDGVDAAAAGDAGVLCPGEGTGRLTASPGAKPCRQLSCSARVAVRQGNAGRAAASSSPMSVVSCRWGQLIDRAGCTGDFRQQVGNDVLPLNLAWGRDVAVVCIEQTQPVAGQVGIGHGASKCVAVRHLGGRCPGHAGIVVCRRVHSRVRQRATLRCACLA